MTNTERNMLMMPIEAVRLSNGIRCLLRSHEHGEIVAVQALLDISVFDESEKHIGLAHLVQRMLRRGTVKRSAQELAEALESLGASLSASMLEDCAMVSLQTTSDQVDKAVALMAEVLWEPAFAPEEVSRERDQILAEIRLRDDDPFHFTHRHFRRALYGNHPYGHPVEGTPNSVPLLNTGLCRQWHRRHFRPDNTLLVAVGHFEPKTLVQLFNRHLGKRTQPGAAIPRLEERLRPLSTHRPRRTVMTRDVEQAICIVGWPAPSISNMDDAVALRVATAILGGGMSSRLFQRLRDQQGLAYSVGCAFGLRRSTGNLIGHIGTRPDQASHASRSIVKEVQTLGKEPVDAEELDRAKTYLKGIHLTDHQTNLRQAWHLGWGELVGLGHGFDARWPMLIDAVTPGDIMRVIRRHVTTPTMVTLRPDSRNPR